MRPWITLSVMLLVAGLSFAACNGSSSIYVPAVLGSGGGLVQVSLKLIPGYGNIYLATYPRTAVSTQVSMDDAVLYGFSAAERNIQECDVLITIHGGELADFVEGPSAGAATAVLTYSALEGKTIPPQATITGMVDAEGNVEPVGGVYEKVRASAQQGLRYFLMPPATLHDRVLLLPLTREYNIEILEA